MNLLLALPVRLVTDDAPKKKNPTTPKVSKIMRHLYAKNKCYFLVCTID